MNFYQVQLKTYMVHEMLTKMPELRVDFQVLVSTKCELFFFDFGGHGCWTKKGTVRFYGGQFSKRIMW